MLKVGLTGGIGSGKSAVSRLLAARGAVVVDADAIAREVVEPGTPGLAAVVAEFGDGVLRPDGTLDRPALGAIVFSDPQRLAALNAIVHPLIAARTGELVAAAPADAVVVHDVPLLTENDLAPGYDVVVVVDVRVELQLDRLVRLRGMTEADARARIAAQATREQRLAVADLVIDNSGTLEQLAAQVDVLWAELESRAGRA
ncbi:MAG: dephospho-CoA kinase [Motilibacteraceae bacterium]